MARYLLVKPHPYQSVVLDADTFVIVMPDDVDPYTVNVVTAADDSRFAIIPLIHDLEWEDVPPQLETLTRVERGS